MDRMVPANPESQRTHLKRLGAECELFSLKKRRWCPVTGQGAMGTN